MSSTTSPCSPHHQWTSLPCYSHPTPLVGLSLCHPPILVSSQLFCACTFGFSICVWDSVTGKLCPDSVLGLGALSHVSGPLWACWGTPAFSLTPPALCPWWPRASQYGLCQRPACKPLPVGQLSKWHGETMLRLVYSPVSPGHLSLHCVLLHEYDHIDPEKNLDKPMLGSSFSSTCSFSSSRAIYQRKGKLSRVSQ